MKIFALSDLHLSFDENYKEYKPMGIFGENWENHSSKIKANWEKLVSPEDIVLVPGDISWALKLEEIQYDFEFIEKLPGLKIITKGNHDLWWQSLTKVQRILPNNMVVLQNNHYLIDNRIAICGTRGWLCPSEKSFVTKHDLKIYNREIGRLRLSLESIPRDISEIIVMFHYPPVNSDFEYNDFINIMQEYGVQTCLYGHLHAEAIQKALPEEKWGINFHLVSADAVNFTPKLILKI